MSDAYGLAHPYEDEILELIGFSPVVLLRCLPLSAAQTDIWRRMNEHRCPKSSTYWSCNGTAIGARSLNYENSERKCNRFTQTFINNELQTVKRKIVIVTVCIENEFKTVDREMYGNALQTNSFEAVEKEMYKFCKEN